MEVDQGGMKDGDGGSGGRGRREKAGRIRDLRELGVGLAPSTPRPREGHNLPLPQGNQDCSGLAPHFLSREPLLTNSGPRKL